MNHLVLWKYTISDSSTRSCRQHDRTSTIFYIGRVLFSLKVHFITCIQTDALHSQLYFGFICPRTLSQKNWGLSMKGFANISLAFCSILSIGVSFLAFAHEDLFILWCMGRYVLKPPLWFSNQLQLVYNSQK